MIDDDITEWWFRENDNGCKKSDISFLQNIENYLLNYSEKDNVGQFGLYHCVWGCKKNCVIPFLSENVGVVQVVGFNLKNINIEYDSYLNGMEDQDLSLRLLKSGVKILRFNHYSFKTFGKGKNKGGLFNFYQKNPFFETVKRFYAKHFNENKKIISWKIKDEKIIINWKKSFNMEN